MTILRLVFMAKAALFFRSCDVQAPRVSSDIFMHVVRGLCRESPPGQIAVSVCALSSGSRRGTGHERRRRLPPLCRAHAPAGLGDGRAGHPRPRLLLVATRDSLGLTRRKGRMPRALQGVLALVTEGLLLYAGPWPLHAVLTVRRSAPPARVGRQLPCSLHRRPGRLRACAAVLRGCDAAGHSVEAGWPYA